MHSKNTENNLIRLQNRNSTNEVVSQSCSQKHICGVEIFRNYLEQYVSNVNNQRWGRL